MSVWRSLWLSALFACGLCHAHQDRIIAIESDGTLQGLPREFSPARLRVAFSSVAGREGKRISTVELTLGGRTTRLPDCLTAVLQTRRLEDVKAAASWYHDETTLPHYLAVKFHDPGYRADAAFNSGFALLFNLRTAELIDTKVDVVRDGGRTVQMLPLDVARLCSTSEMRLLDPVK